MLPSLHASHAYTCARRELLHSKGYVYTNAVQWDDWFVHEALMPRMQRLHQQQ